MPKMKTNKALAKRIRVTKKGKVLRGRAGRRHLLSHKSSNRKRKLRKTTVVYSAFARKYQEAVKQ